MFWGDFHILHMLLCGLSYFCGRFRGIRLSAHPVASTSSKLAPTTPMSSSSSNSGLSREEIEAF